MLVIPPPKFRQRRGRVKSTPVLAPVALVLVAASFDSDETVVVLTFDRAIDISGLDGSLIGVNDPVETNTLFVATDGAELLSDTTVQLFLEGVGDASGSEVVLNAAAGNGIVAVDDGGVWAGVMNLSMPFP